jgi:hypothetical protein
MRLGGPGVSEALHKSQWLWRKNPENLTDQEQARLAKIRDKHLGTAKAYQMRLVLQDIYRSAHAVIARRRFQVWCRWVRWVAHFYQAKGNLLASMVKLAQMIANHLAGILAHWNWGVTNAFLKGLNSVFSATKRKARGYRSTTHLISMLYFIAGKLRFSQCYRITPKTAKNPFVAPATRVRRFPRTAGQRRWVNLCIRTMASLRFSMLVA